MRRLPASVFGMMLSSCPAVAAIIAFVILGEKLTLAQAFAILCIMVASAGSAITASLAR